MRSAFVMLFVCALWALHGCGSQCTTEPSCDALTESFEVPFSGTTDSLAEARFELCRGDGCIATSMGAGNGRATCRPFVTEAPVTCSRSGDGPIVVDDRGALGGTIRVRIFGPSAEGSEVLLAERSVEMVREEYEVTSTTCGDRESKACVRYVAH